MNDPFPRLYEAYTSDSLEDLPFWRSLAHAASGPLLELGCGTGRVLLDLAAQGFDVTGIDNHPGMLERAASNARQLGLFPQLIEADLLHYSLARRFSLILVPCNTFAYFDQQQAEEVLTCTRRHVQPGGLLALDLPHPRTTLAELHALPEDEPVAIFTEPESGHPVQVFAQPEDIQPPGCAAVRWSFDELLPNGGVQRVQHGMQLHLRSSDQMQELLRRTGFTLEASYGDHSRQPLTPDSPRLLILARPLEENLKPA